MIIIKNMGLQNKYTNQIDQIELYCLNFLFLRRF